MLQSRAGEEEADGADQGRAGVKKAESMHERRGWAKDDLRRMERERDRTNDANKDTQMSLGLRSTLDDSYLKKKEKRQGEE